MTSDQATITIHFIKHGDLLTLAAQLDDPIYLAEPYYITRSYVPSPTLMNALALTRQKPRTKIVIITPAKAEAMLKRNQNNRHISKNAVQVFAADMKAGLWDLNGESIIIDWFDNKSGSRA